MGDLSSSWVLDNPAKKQGSQVPNLMFVQDWFSALTRFKNRTIDLMEIEVTTYSVSSDYLGLSLAEQLNTSYELHLL